MAGAVFGEVGVSLFVAGAALREILIDSRSAKCCIFPYKMRLQGGTRKVSEAAGARWRFYRRIMFGLCSDYRRIVFLLAEAIHGVSAQILNLQISWQAQYLVRLEADCACSAHCKWRFISDADQSWDSFCVAGAVFGEVGLCDSCCSAHCKWRFICECDADQSWDSFCVAGAVFGEVGLWFLLLRAL